MSEMVSFLQICCSMLLFTLILVAFSSSVIIWYQRKTIKKLKE